ncbi:MAG: PilZ domain-containing protein [Hyphomicrobiaceae bacterium]
MFWRKRNADLDKRLNTVIESSERVRKSNHLPPSRVTIDTSYADAEGQDYDEAALFNAEHGCGAQPQDVPDSGSSSAASETSDEGLRRDDDAWDDVEFDPALQTHPAETTPVAACTATDELAVGLEQIHADLLRRAELAEREVEAVYAAAEQQDQAARETYEALQRETDARRAAEAARDALSRRADESEAALAAMRAMAETHQQSLTSAKEALEREVVERQALAKERDALAVRLDEAEAKALALPKLSADFDDRLREARQSMEDETATRGAAEAARDALAVKFEALEAELQALRAAGASREDTNSELSDTILRETAARAAAEAARDALAVKLEAVEAELQALRDGREALQSEHHETAASLALEIKARRAAVAEREQANARAEEHAAEHEQLRARLAEREAALSEAEASAQRDAAARRALEADLGEAIRKADAAEAEAASLKALDEANKAQQQEMLAQEREASARRVAEAEAASLKALDEANKAQEQEMLAQEREASVRCVAEAEQRASEAEAEAASLKALDEANKAQEQEMLAQEREASARRVAEAEQRASEARDLAEAREAALREAREALAREAAVRQAVEAERDEWIKRMAETDTQVAALKQAFEMKPEATVSSAAEPFMASIQPDEDVVACETVAEDTTAAVSPAVETQPTARLTRRALADLVARPSDPMPAPTSASSAATTEAAHEPEVNTAAPVGSGSIENRRDRRLASQMPATLWREGMGQPLPCTLRDRSSSGARLEFKHASIIEGFSAFNTGDQVTLTLNSAHEKTWVTCEVVWIEGNRCGVRFSGQFRSEGPTSRKPMRAPAAEKPQRPKAGSRLASIFSTRGS